MRDTSKAGQISVAEVIRALVKLGKYVLLPFGDYKRYDLVIEEDDGRFRRVQCKTGRVIKGAISFYPCSVDSRSEPGRCIRKTYGGQIDLFGVYCPDNGKVYLVPIDHVGDQLQCLLRIEPTRNNQQKRVRWARDYEVELPQTEVVNLDLTFPVSAD
jgi:hypothetical protein